MELADAVESDLVAFAVALREQGLAPASAKRTLVAVRNLHKYLRIEECRDRSRSVDRTPGARHVGAQGADRGADHALLDAAQGVTPAGYRDRAILEVLYGTGMRISELCGMSISDVDFEDQMTRVVGKGDRERLVPSGVRHEVARRMVGPNGSPTTRTEAMEEANRRGCSVSQPARWTPHPSGGMGNRSSVRPDGRFGGPCPSARFSPFLCDAHVEPWRRYPNRARTTRPRIAYDHSDLHEGFNGTTTKRLRPCPP